MNNMGNMRFGTLTVLRLRYLEHYLHRIIHRWLTKHVYTKYWYWRLKNECWPFVKRNPKKGLKTFELRPTFALFTLIRPDDQLTHIQETLDAVQAQIYPDWIWILFCGREQEEKIRTLVINAVHRQRIHIITGDITQLRTLLDILPTTAGDFAAFIGANDTLAPFALYEICREINLDPAKDLFYADEDHLNEKGHRVDPWFKQEYSIHNLRTSPCSNSFLVLRKTLLQKILATQLLEMGGTGTENWCLNLFDISLRASEYGAHVGQIPEILSHHRGTRKLGGTETCSVEPDAEARTDMDILRGHLQRQQIAAEVSPNNYPNSFHVRYAIQGEPLVSVIVPTRDQTDNLRRCINAIRENTTYANYEIVIADDNSALPETFACFDKLKADPSFRGDIVRWDKPSNTAWIYNVTARHAKGDFLLFLSDTMEVLPTEATDWMKELLLLAQLPEVGAVGGKLFTPSGKLLHAGMAWEQLRNLVFFNPAEGMDGKLPGYYGFTRKTHSVRMLSAACMMMKRSRFEQVGGFDGNFSLAFYDADLCLKLREISLLNMYTPYAQLIQHGSLPAQRKKDEAMNREAAKNYRTLLKKWQPIFAERDLSLSPHLRFRQFFQESI